MAYERVKPTYIKIALTCFGAVTPSSGSALFVLSKVTLVKIANYALLEGGVTAPKHVRAILIYILILFLRQSHMH